jgi:hypothetical protein
MNPLKIIEELIKIKEEMRGVRLKIEHFERQIDHLSGDMLEYLKHKRIIETRTV